MDKEKFKEIPIGTGRESEPKETLPAVEVKNKVIWVNEDFEKLPFKLKEGESTGFGVFLTPKPKGIEEPVDLKVSEEHMRSALLGRIIFEDNQGRLYRDLDLKGMGYVEFDPRQGLYVAKPGIKGRTSLIEDRSAWGILYRGYAEAAQLRAEQFLAAGIRTERYIALIKLKEIINETGEKISIKKAVEKKMIAPDQEPVIALRAFGTKLRIDDVSANEEALEDAKRIVAQELGISEKGFSWEKYLKWFTKTAGENLGLIHKNKWSHRYLSPHNITLDCRIVDLDSVREIGDDLPSHKKETMMQEDYESLNESIFNNTYSLSAFIEEHVSSEIDEDKITELKEIFKKSYTKSLGYTPKFLAEKEE